MQGTVIVGGCGIGAAAGVGLLFLLAHDPERIDRIRMRERERGAEYLVLRLHADRPPRREDLAMSVTDRYLQNNELYASHFAGPQQMTPSEHVAVVACMDARMDVYGILGLQEGEASVIRNAGGVVTDDVIRSLAVSQQLLGTREIILIHHTDCRMLTFPSYSLDPPIRGEDGLKPLWPEESFHDVAIDVRRSISRIKSSKYIPHHDAVRGFIFDVSTGRLDEVK
ncbi:beta-class carbonic anhydrase [Streptomyces rugosispiralis]|nr:carbonic anhydrase [Streptomyces rugosispiralis]